MEQRYQSAQEYFGGRRLLPPSGVVGVSQSLHINIKNALLLATIESLWLSLDEARLFVLMQKSSDALEHCKGFSLLERGCRHFIDVLSKMVKHLEKGLPVASDCLCEFLGNNSHELLQYLSWLYQEYTTEDLAREICEVNCKSVEMYCVTDNRVVQSLMIGESTPKQHGLERVVLLSEGVCQHILYEYTPEQLINVGTMILRARQHIQVVIDKVSTTKSQLEERTLELERANESLLEARRINKDWKLKLRESEQESQRLSRLVVELNSEKVRLERQIIHTNAHYAKKLQDLSTKAESYSTQKRGEHDSVEQHNHSLTKQRHEVLPN